MAYSLRERKQIDYKKMESGDDELEKKSCDDTEIKEGNNEDDKETEVKEESDEDDHEEWENLMAQLADEEKKERKSRKS